MFIWKLINSPFKIPKIKFYLGKVAKTVPYFLPRKLVKYTMEESLIEAQKLIEKKWSTFFGKDVNEVATYHNKAYLKFVDKKVGYNIVRLGYKYKFNSIRFE